MTDLNRIRPAFRTKGAVTGNFGRAKCKAGSRLSDLGVTSAKVVKPTDPAEYAARLADALAKTTDPKLLAFLSMELKRLEVQSGKTLKRVDHSGRTAEPYRTPGT